MTSLSERAALELARETGALACASYGEDAQRWMLIEEAGEVLRELGHERRGRDAHVDDEIADLALVVLGLVDLERLRERALALAARLRT